jgi:hypothetical protein
MIRVAQCFTGGVGSEIVRRLATHPSMELVGVLVHSGEKAGRDAGDVVGVDRIGVTTTQRIQDIIALRPDAAVWSGLGFEPERLAQLLEAGINVYTGLGGYYMDGLPERAVLESACERGASTFAAGGNIPGLISDALPIFVSGFTGRVRHITAHQRNHVSHYPSATQLARGLGLGEAPSPDDPVTGVELTPHDRQWEWLIGMSAAMVAAALSIPYDGLRTRRKEQRVSPATITLPGSGLTIEQGSVGGVRWTWDAYSGDRLFLTVINEQTGVYALDEGWRQDETAPAWTVTMDADPPMIATLTWPAGIPAAEANARLNAARAINFLPPLVASAPGCRSILDLPLIPCSDAVR